MKKPKTRTPQQVNAQPELPPAWVMADSVISQGFAPDLVAIELGAEVLRPHEDGVRVETVPTAHLRMTVRGFLRLRAALNEIATGMENANKAAIASQSAPVIIH